MTILFDIAVDGGASQWYGVISITNIRHRNGTAVEVDSFLGLKFRSPAQVQPTDITRPRFPTTSRTTSAAT